MAKAQMRRRLQEPEEIANVVALLVTEEADAINGPVVMTDDGYDEFK